MEQVFFLKHGGNYKALVKQDANFRTNFKLLKHGGTAWKFKL